MKHLDKFIAFENEEIYELSLYLEFALEYAKLKDYRGTISGINYYKRKFDSFYGQQTKRDVQPIGPTDRHIRDTLPHGDKTADKYSQISIEEELNRR